MTERKVVEGGTKTRRRENDGESGGDKLKM